MIAADAETSDMSHPAENTHRSPSHTVVRDLGPVAPPKGLRANTPNECHHGGTNSPTAVSIRLDVDSERCEVPDVVGENRFVVDV